MYEFLEGMFFTLTEYGVLILEVVGAALIIIAAVRAFIALVSKTGNCKLIMGEGITTALSFLLGGEALKTITAPNWMELGMTAAILAMRAAMAVLIHWETQHEAKPE